jgi:hypothetical protein
MSFHVIFDKSEIDKIDFAQIIQNSEEDLASSTDGLRSYISFEVEPTFLSTLSFASRIYEDFEMQAILYTHEWLAPIS